MIMCRGVHSLVTAIGITLVVSFVLIFSHGITHASELSIDYKSGKLSAEIKDASFKRVMVSLAKKCNFPIVLDESLQTKKISVKFENLELEKGIKRIIQPYSSTIIFAEDHTADGKTEFYVLEVRIYDKSKNNSFIAIVDDSIEEPVEERERTQKALREASDVVPDSPILKAKKARKPGENAEISKKISTAMLQTQISRAMSKMRQMKMTTQNEENRLRQEISRFESELHSASDSDAKRVNVQLNAARAELSSMRNQNTSELTLLQMELDHMRSMVRFQKRQYAKSVM